MKLIHTLPRNNPKFLEFFFNCSTNFNSIKIVSGIIQSKSNNLCSLCFRVSNLCSLLVPAIWKTVLQEGLRICFIFLVVLTDHDSFARWVLLIGLMSPVFASLKSIFIKKKSKKKINLPSSTSKPSGKRILTVWFHPSNKQTGCSGSN